MPRVLGLGDDGPAWRSEEARHPPLVTNDSHYTYAHEATAHDAPLCIQTGKNLSDPDPFKFDGTGYYLKSTDEMHAIDSSDAWQQGCANTLLVAEMVDTTDMFEAKNLVPKFDIPDGYTEVTWFQEEVRRGMERRFPGGAPDDRQKQAEYEMDVIIQMGFPGYFVAVTDFSRMYISERDGGLRRPGHRRPHRCPLRHHRHALHQARPGVGDEAR